MGVSADGGSMVEPVPTRRGTNRDPRIRVLHVITWMDLGGAQGHLLTLVKGLDPSRFQVEVAVGTSDGARGDLFQPLTEVCKVRPLVHLVRQVDARHDLLAPREIGRLIDEIRPDIVHTHSSKAGVVGRIATRGRSVRTVHNVHGWSFEPLEGPVRKVVVDLERWLAKRTDVVLNVSERDRDLGRSLGIRPRRSAEIVRSGVDIERFAGGIERERRGHVVLGTVGRLAEPKDPVGAVEAFAKLAAQRADLTFRWIGDGPLRPEVEAAIDRHGLGGRFEITGFQHDVPAALADLDVFVLSSIWEGLPRSIVEAAAAGVPIVATDVGGVGELIRDGQTGRLVPARDPEALAAAMEAMIDDPGAASSMVLEAKAAVVEFSAAEMCRQTAAVYEQLVR